MELCAEFQDTAKIKVLPKLNRNGKELSRGAFDIQDAWDRGLFTGGMSFDEFQQRIFERNPQLKIIRGEFSTGLFDTELGKFVIGISRFHTIPRFTIVKHDPSKDKKIDYTDENGNFTGTQKFNQDDENGKILARSWISVFNSLKAQGYEVKDEDIDY